MYVFRLECVLCKNIVDMEIEKMRHIDLYIVMC